MSVTTFSQAPSMAAVARFGWRLLRRKPSAELWLFLSCQIFAVTIVCGILLFTQRIEWAIYSENAKLMAADLLVESSRAIDQKPLAQWQQYASEQELQTASSIRLSSMLYFEGALQLTEVRAVGQAYPLRGQLTIAPDLSAQPSVATVMPSQGEVWLDARTARGLAAMPGDFVELGSVRLKFVQVLHDEPGLVLPSLGLSGRALMNENDLSETGLLSAGSRATYTWLLAGEHARIEHMMQWLTPQLGPHQRVFSSQQGSQRTTRTIERAKSFLNLGGATALLLALVATLVTAYKYLEREQHSVAVWKAAGFSSSLLSRGYLLQFAAWWLGASVLGCAAGFTLQAAGFYAIRDWVGVSAGYSWQPFILAVLTALFCLVCFALPVVQGLSKVSPMRLLRSGTGLKGATYTLLWLLPAFTLLLHTFSENWQATLAVVGSLLLLVIFCWLLVALLVMGLQRFLALTQTKIMALMPVVYLGLRAFSRQRRPSQIRTTALAMTLSLLVVVVSLRSELLTGWQAQIPDAAPNYFALNITESERDRWHEYGDEAGISSQGLFPVARARLVAINGQPTAERAANNPDAQRALSREMVMTEAATLPLGNKVVLGQWHGNHQQASVSVEQSIAQQLDIELGDKLQFSFANQAVEVEVGSIRSLNWNSMQPNFYFILSPPLLKAYPYTYMTSFLAVPQQADALYELGSQFPAVALIDVGDLMAQVKSVLDRVGLAVQALAVVTVFAALLVLVASLRASLDDRLHEQSILRALGGQAATLKRIAMVELGFSGLVAGLVGCGSGALFVFLFGRQVFELPMALGLGTAVWVLVISVAAVIAVGLAILNRVYAVSPLVIWRKS